MIPDELKRRRKAMNLRQEDLAVLLKVSRNTVNRWETGTHAIPDAAAEAMTVLDGEKSSGLKSKIKWKPNEFDSSIFRTREGVVVLGPDVPALPDGTVLWNISNAAGEWRRVRKRANGRVPPVEALEDSNEARAVHNRWKPWRPWYGEPLPMEVLRDD